jgi:hypothetical protein
MRQISLIRILDLTPPNESGPPRRLFENVRDSIEVERIATGVSYHKLDSRLKFEFFVLDELKLKGRVAGDCSILHFEAHGDEDGILTGDDRISWAEFYTMLRPLNIRTRHSLIVNFAACKAAWSIVHFDMTKPAPLFSIIAPQIELSVGQCNSAFGAFYKILAATKDLTAARHALKRESDQLNAGFHLTSAPTIFWDGMKNYLEVHARGKPRQLRLESLVTRLMEAGFDGKKMRPLAKGLLWADQEPVVRAAFMRFNMIDRFPELAQELPFEMPAII